jgi:D-glycero-D-manno-heptose 1,7-bisphosphate phosphatase
MTIQVHGDPPVGRKATPVLYLDIDGTVREGKDDPLGRFVNGPEDVRVFPEAAFLMGQWKARGGRIVGVSNQGGVALGHLTLADAVQAMSETDRQAGGLFDRIMVCAHHPDAADPEVARCWCRKPAPGLLIEAALVLGEIHREFYPPHLALMVGDRVEDAECATICSIDFLWASEWRAHAEPSDG